MKTLLFALLVAVASVASTGTAGTVTLMGSCTSSAASNFIILNMTNTGSETASNMSITNQFFGISVYQPGQHIQLAPGAHQALYFPIGSIPEYNGTYAGEFVVDYNQGSSAFSAVFPCLADSGVKTNSNISVSAIGQPQQGRLSVQITSTDTASRNVTLNWLLPNGFSVNESSVSITMPAQSQRTLAFILTAPVSESPSPSSSPSSPSSYTIAAAVSYTAGNLHFASVYPYLLGIQQSGSGAISAADMFPIVFIVIAVLIILALIILSALRKRKRKRQKQEQE